MFLVTVICRTMIPLTENRTGQIHFRGGRVVRISGNRATIERAQSATIIAAAVIPAATRGRIFAGKVAANACHVGFVRHLRRIPSPRIARFEVG